MFTGTNTVTGTTILKLVRKTVYYWFEVTGTIEILILQLFSENVGTSKCVVVFEYWIYLAFYWFSGDEISEVKTLSRFSWCENLGGCTPNLGQNVVGPPIMQI